MHYTFMMSANENVFPMSIHTQPQPHAYLDFAAGVGRAPLACCLEILEACPRAELAAVYHQNQTQNRITFAFSAFFLDSSAFRFSFPALIASCLAA